MRLIEKKWMKNIFFFELGGKLGDGYLENLFSLLKKKKIYFFVCKLKIIKKGIKVCHEIETFKDLTFNKKNSTFIFTKIFPFLNYL